jgi:RND family efflux transporter MFP subunit
MRQLASASTALGLLALALLAGCGLFPRESSTEEPVLPEPPEVSTGITYPVARADIALTIQGSAEVTPVRETALYFRESGRIREVATVAGARVAAGAVLARLDSGGLEHELRLASIDVRIAELELERIEATGGTLFDRSIQELAVARQRENADYLRERLEASTIRAPYDGIVRSVSYAVSDRVADYATVIQLTDPSSLELQMEVSASQLDAVTPGREARVRTAENAWVPSSVIGTTRRAVGEDAARRERYLVELSLPRALSGEPPGRMLAAEVILDKRAAALVIPLAGLREFQGRTYVRVLDGDLRREVDVRVGIRTDTQAEILEGLTEGQKVIGR